MSSDPLWPFFFEVNVVHPPTFRERTLFVIIQEDGAMRWMDHSGRFGHSGGIGGLTGLGTGELQHFRGDKVISNEQAAREEAEFSITLAPDDYDFEPIRAFITRMGKQSQAGWPLKDSAAFHELLVIIYWEQVNQFVVNPFPKP